MRGGEDGEERGGAMGPGGEYSESNGGNEKEDSAVAEKILKNWRESWMVL